MTPSGKTTRRGLAGLLLCLLLPATTVAGSDAPSWPPRLELSHVLVQTSLYTTHFSPRDEHNNQQDLISVEFNNSDRWLAGLAWFKNSYDQPTWYGYVGRKFPFWEPAENLSFRAKLTAGALHGYQGEYRDNIPFNRYGTAPAVLPSVGLRWERFEADLIVFGVAGAMVTGGIRF